MQIEVFTKRQDVAANNYFILVITILLRYYISLHSQNGDIIGLFSIFSIALVLMGLELDLQIVWNTIKVELLITIKSSTKIISETNWTSYWHCLSIWVYASNSLCFGLAVSLHNLWKTWIASSWFLSGWSQQQFLGKSRLKWFSVYKTNKFHFRQQCLMEM